MDFVTKFKNYFNAGFSAIYITTHEEQRVVKDVLGILANNPAYRVHEWDCQLGLVESATHEAVGQETDVSTQALKYIQNFRGDDKVKNVFILKDFHLHFDKVINIRMVRNLRNILKGRGNMIVFIGHKFQIPAELQKEIQVLDYELPGVASIQERLTYVLASANKGRADAGREPCTIPQEITDGAIEAAKGMTFSEIEDAFAMAYTTNKEFNEAFVDTVFDEKIAQLKKGGLLTYIPSDVSFENVGGLTGLKHWIATRKKAYTQEARDFHLPLPKGILLCSVPGQGKTLISKAIAAELDCPLFQFDMGAIFDSHVGNSEKNMREAIKTIESIGKCVILID